MSATELSTIGGITKAAGDIGSWTCLLCFLLVYFYVDIGVLGNHPELLCTASWQFLCLLFWLIIDGLTAWALYYIGGTKMFQTYGNGLLLESLFSLDNLILFYLIFRSMGTPSRLYGRVLSCGMLLACPLRLLCYWLEFRVIQAPWVILATGIILIISGLWALYTALITKPDNEWKGDEHGLVKWLVKTGRCVPYYDVQGRFFVQNQPLTTYPATTDGSIDVDADLDYFTRRMTKEEEQNRMLSNRGNKQWQITLLFVVLIMVELADLLFAADATIANVAISDDLFICYISSIFGLFTMRTLFASIGGILEKLWLMQYVLAIMLIGIGIRIVAEPWYHIDSGKFRWALSVYLICGVLLAVMGYLVKPHQNVQLVQLHTLPTDQEELQVSDPEHRASGDDIQAPEIRAKDSDIRVSDQESGNNSVEGFTTDNK